jgi:hypothetical protein
MLEDLKETFRLILDCDEFKEWKKEHRRAYLSSVFLDRNLQFIFFDPDEDRMCSFWKDGDVVFKEESDVFRRDKKEIKELNLSDVRVGLEKAESIARKSMEKGYGKIEKKIIILQVIQGVVWNITYIDEGLNVFNVKVDAVDGEIKEVKTENLLNFRA